jgi:predicted ATPase/ATP/maltotriose-dependent transcriptional regulator MalT
MARTTPTIQTNQLFYREHGNELQLTIGSPEWYTWLETATSFIFHDPSGSFTARRERSTNKRGGWYWKAYSRRGGKLRHAYLGKAEALTLEHLRAVALELARQDQQEPSTTDSDGANLASSALLSPEADELQHAHMLDIIGREQETRAACSILLQPEVRLLTITGPGGVGKTRFALHVAKVLADRFADGVYSVSLAPITDPALVITAIAQVFGFVKAGDEPLFSRLTRFLREKRLLLLLDNFEQVISAAPQLVEIVATCPHIKLIVTSREILHIRLEHEFSLPPLAFPDTSSLSGVPEQLDQYSAIDLFVQRARAVKADFRLTAANAVTIAEICTRLDGLPLAIELAAARSKLLSPTALLTRLDHSLILLTQGARDLPRRQQTLRDTIAWSYDLLDPEEQRIFRHLSVFVGDCTLAEAEQFCLSFWPDNPSILEGIASLADKNLLQRIEKSNGDIALSMLETIREYGLESLVTSEEDFQAHQTHALYYLSIAEQAASVLRTAQQDAWLNRLESDYPNIQAALRWFSEQELFEEALRLCTALWLFWLVRDRQSEGYQWGERVLTRSTTASIAPEIKARATYAIGVLADHQGHYQRAAELWEESLKLANQVDDRRGIVAAYNRLGRAAARNDPTRAHDLYKKSLTLAQQWNVQYGIADALTSLADEASEPGDFDRARPLLDEALLIYTQLGDKRSRAYCLGGLGHVAAGQSKHAEAYAHLTESLTLYRDIGDRINIALGLVPLGMVTLYLGDYSTAHHLFEESLNVSKELGNQNEIASYLGTLGEIALEQNGEQGPARALFEESLAIFRDTGNEEGIASRLFALGSFELSQGNYTAARKFLDECEAVFRKLGNRSMRASTLYLLGHLEAHKGNYALGRRLMEESVQLTRQIGDHWVLSSRLAYLGLTMTNGGKYNEARPLLQESISLARKNGDSRSIAESLSVMGLLYMNERNYPAALASFNECRAILQHRDDRPALSYCLADLGSLAINQGDMKRARPLIDEALSISLQLRDRWFVASCLERLGEIEVGEQNFSLGAELWGCATALRELIAAPMPPIEQAAYDRAMAIVRANLSEGAFQAAWQSGYQKRPEQFLGHPESSERNDIILTPKLISKYAPLLPPSTLPSIPSMPDKLTSREAEVLQLVAKGFTNTQIGEQLVISPRTVQTHLSSIYSKIRVSSRSAATRYALENNLT